MNGYKISAKALTGTVQEYEYKGMTATPKRGVWPVSEFSHGMDWDFWDAVQKQTIRIVFRERS